MLKICKTLKLKSRIIWKFLNGLVLYLLKVKFRHLKEFIEMTLNLKMKCLYIYLLKELDISG